MAAEVINSRYEVIETLSSSDSERFSIVKARDASDGRVVTLKILPAVLIAERPELPAALAQAVTALQPMLHPNILAAYETGETRGIGDFYIVAEYMRGITLKERIRRVAPFSLTVAVDIAVAIAEALDFAHQSGIVHGDLQPQDVLLSPEGQIKVDNFSVGRVIAVSAGSQMDASLPYLPPESDLADSPTVSSDLYAVGAMLYEMLTGKVPPGDKRALPPSPRALNSGIPPALEGLILKSLQPMPEMRYAAAANLLSDLRAVRDALRSGKSLAWSPLTEKRAPRVPLEQTIMGVRPPVASSAAGKKALQTAAQEIKDERLFLEETDPGAALGSALKVLFVAVILGVIALSWYATRFFAVPNDVIVPNLIGKTFDDAKSIAQREHFMLTEGGSDYSAKWPENQIYQQDPLEGHAIKAGKAVTVYRSLGPRLLTVPDLAGMTLERATRALQEANLPVGIVTQQFSEIVQKGVIVSQNPPPGTNVPRNKTVDFVVSKGKQPPDIPANVQADTPAFDEADLHWDPAAHADSYTVSRDQDGSITIVAQGLKDTRFTDKGLSPETSYSYTVTAVNAVGDSGPSDPVLVTTPAKVTAPAVIGPDVQLNPPDNTAPSADNGPVSPSSPDAAPSRMRKFTVSFRVPRHPRRTRHIQFEVQDITGTTLVYDENRDPGDQVDAPITGFGNKVTIRIFLDSKLVKQETL